MTVLFDHRNPDYDAVYMSRAKSLQRLRQMSPRDIAALKLFYRDDPVAFINDWGETHDPRIQDNSTGSNVLPFILFDKQAEYIDWVYEMWRNQESGVCAKSRDVGMSWVSVAIAAHIALFYQSNVIGFGSRKEEYIDKSGSPKALFWKLRKFLMSVPRELRGGFDEYDKNLSVHKRLTIPETGSAIIGEAGDNVGRGDRASIYFVDESAFIERPELIEASLSATTNCRIDVSSANGSNNPFYEKYTTWPAHKTFTFKWTDDPRKDQAWYEKQKLELSPVVVAQEIDINFSVGGENVVIPSEWITGAIDLHKHLNTKFVGNRFAAFDPSGCGDTEGDDNAIALRVGPVLFGAKEWRIKGQTLFEATRDAANFAASASCFNFKFDTVGVGMGVGDNMMMISQARRDEKLPVFNVLPYAGSESVVDPDGTAVETASSTGTARVAKRNKDMFANLKAQSWWHLRTMFENSYRASIGQPYDPDKIIILDREAFAKRDNMRVFDKMIRELSQPTYSVNNVGKFVIDKKPAGKKSPNIADAVVMLFAPSKKKNGFF